MIDVLEPPSKYGDTAELVPQGGGEHPSSASATPSIMMRSSTSILSARGRGIASELDEDGVIPLEEDGEEGDEELEESQSGGQHLLHNNPPTGSSHLKASLLDYVLSEVANNSRMSMMDLSGSGGVGVLPLRQQRRGKYAFNPEEDSMRETVPHLSEYFQRNVIAVLNRCDPGTWGRCYSCGNPPPPVAVAPPPKSGQRGGASLLSGSPGEVDVDTFWNYYNYKSDYRTIEGGTSGGVGGSVTGYQYQYHSEPTSPWSGGSVGSGSGSNSNSSFFPQMEGARLSGCGSDLDNGGAGGVGVGGGQEMMEDEEVFTFDARLLSEAFLSSGRVDHTIQLMAYHPDYLEIFLKTHHFLMRGDGPLPYNFRNYIAIMAAARYRCSYLMELQKREFLYQGGDPNWLRGLDCAPAKLTALYNINKVMAHRPWVLKKEDLQHLTKKAGWSLSEVVQAVVILAHFHSLSSFIHGCGITPEVDFDNGHSFLLDPSRIGGGGDPHPHQLGHHRGSVSFALEHLEGASGPGGEQSGGNSPPKQTKSILKKTENNLSHSAGIGINVPQNFHHSHLYHSSVPTYLNPSPTAQPSLLKSDTLHNSLCGPSLASSPPRGSGPGPLCSSSAISEVDIIMATMKNLSETSPIEDPEERKKRFETVARSDVDGHDQKENLQRSKPSLPHHHASMLPPDVSPFISEPDFTYEDFAKRGQISELHTFRIQDYSWEEHGFSLVNRLYAEVGQILDDKFKVAQSMTYYTIGGRANVDTTKFRTAVWNYIQCLYGIRHDDYDYGEVNQLLERPLKAFIKTVCCYPERITKQDYDNVMREFRHSEKVHVNLMIMEAKLQAELLYGLRTVMKLMF